MTIGNSGRKQKWKRIETKERKKNSKLKPMAINRTCQKKKGQVEMSREEVEYKS